MRTTTDIDDDLLEKAKRLARERRCSLGEVVSEALRQLLLSRERPEPAGSTRLTTFKGRGVRSGVISTAALWCFPPLPVRVFPSYPFYDIFKQCLRYI